MNCKLYATSLKAWDAMLKAISGAKKSIYLEMYIFLDDTSGSHDFIGKLKQKAKEGIRVVIVADAFGSSALKKDSIRAIRESGAEFIFFSKWLRRIHRKILIVDEETAFIGGVNIGKRFSRWNDLQMEIGGRIARKILRSFAYTYEMAGGKNEVITKYRDRSIAKKIRFWTLDHWPVYGLRTLKDHYTKKLSGAKKSIRIVTPYFIPPRWLISLLDAAVKRGVAVEIMVPKQTDYRIADRINYRYMHIVSPLGVRFYLSRRMNHAKILLIDGREGLIGSQNIDIFSFRLNVEAGIFFKENRAVGELQKTVEKWKKEAVDFRSHQFRMKPVDYAILAIMKLLNPIL